MGISIDNHIYDLSELREYTEENCGTTGLAFLELAMPKFGTVVGDQFITLWNEYYEEYNSAREFLYFMEKMTGHEDYDPPYDYVPCGANAREVADELGLEWPEGDDE